MTSYIQNLWPIVKQAPFTFSVGENVIIPGLFGSQIKVLQFYFILGVASNLIYKSGLNPLSGTLFFQAGGSEYQDFIWLPLTCNPGEDFIISSSSGAGGGTIWWAQQ